MLDTPRLIETLIGNGRLSLLEIRVRFHAHCQILNRLFEGAVRFRGYRYFVQDR